MSQGSILIIGRIAIESQELASMLTGMRFRVLRADSLNDARSLVRRHNIETAVVDLDSASFPDVATLTRDWGLTVICVHRLANDKLWLRSLAAGAIDCCYPDDHRQIHIALRKTRHSARTRVMAA